MMKRYNYYAAAGAALLASSSLHATQLEEIVIYAQKKAEMASDVPISVSVATGEFVDNLSITQLDDLSTYIPNFNILETSGGMRVAMRGVGSGTNRGYEQSVGMFVDNIYSSKNKQFAVPFFDVDRVEVLRGPQGVVFGKNTSAGAVSILTARPTSELSGSLSGEYEVEYEDTTLTGIVSGPLTSSLSARLAVRVNEQYDGYLENTSTNRPERQREEELVRLSFVWSPSDELELFSKLEYSDQDILGSNYQLFDFGSNEANFKAYDPQAEDKLDLQNSVGYTDRDAHILTESYNAVVEAFYDMEDFTIVSVTGYSQFDSEVENEDSDFTPVPLLWFDTEDEFEQVSQEFRIEAIDEEGLDFSAGLYYQYNEYQSIPTLSAEASILGFPDSENERLFDQESETWSAFGQVVWNISDSWALQAGLRYNEETKDVTRSLVVQEFGTDIPETDPFILALNAVVFGVQNYSDKDSRKEDNLSPMVGVQYFLDDGGMLYAKYTRGFKGGGFDASDLDGTSPQYEDETVDSFELGAKLSLMDGRGELNTAIFYSEYQDLQVTSLSGFDFITTNAAEATSEGIEVDGRFKVTDNVMLTGSLAYLDAVYENFTDGACTPEQLDEWNNPAPPAVNEGACKQDLSGRPFVYSPEYQANIGLHYESVFADGSALNTSLLVNYVDDQYLQESLPEDSFIEGYTTVDANLVFESKSGRWLFKLIGRNLTDEREKSDVNSSTFYSDARIATIIKPRTYTLGVEYRFQ